MEVQAVVEALVGQVDEVVGRDGHLLREQLHGKRPECRGEGGREGGREEECLNANLFTIILKDTSSKSHGDRWVLSRARPLAASWQSVRRFSFVSVVNIILLLTAIRRDGNIKSDNQN